METRPRPAHPAYWICQIGGWGLYVLVTVFQLRALGLPLGRALLEPLFAAALGIALTHGHRVLINRRGWLTLGPGALTPRVLGASVVLAAVIVAAVSALEVGSYGDRPASLVVLLVMATLRWTVHFFVWQVLYVVLVLLRRRRAAELAQLRLEKALQLAELRALKAQLNPHFLFNSLNSVRALIAIDPDGAQRAITQLASMLRYALHAAEEELVTLAREL
jgi:hypothetical protein